LAEEETPTWPINRAANLRRRCRKWSCRGHPGLQQGVLFQLHHSNCVLCGSTPRQERGTAKASNTSGGSGSSRHIGTQGPCGFTPIWTADNRSVSSGT
jgi:hypothetical protein